MKAERRAKRADAEAAAAVVAAKFEIYVREQEMSLEEFDAWFWGARTVPNEFANSTSDRVPNELAHNEIAHTVPNEFANATSDTVPNEIAHNKIAHEESYLRIDVENQFDMEKKVT